MKCGAFREHLCCVNAIQYPSRVFLVMLIRNKRNSRKMLLCLKRRLLIFSNQLLSHCQSPLSRRSRRPLQNVKHLLIKREAKHAGDESLWSVEKKKPLPLIVLGFQQARPTAVVYFLSGLFLLVPAGDQKRIKAPRDSWALLPISNIELHCFAGLNFSLTFSYKRRIKPISCIQRQRAVWVND